MDERGRAFFNNGRILLEDLIASCDGKSNAIRNYSASELIKATNNFDPSCIIQNCTPTGASQFHHSIHVYHGYKMFKGFLDDRYIIVKKFMGTNDETRSLAIRDIVVSMQMSNHKNVLKLLGCCLEFPIPALVHEYARNGVVSYQGGFGANESLPWRVRLRIAKQLANALTYLHTAFSRPIIHRDLKPNCIFLDEDYVPKLCNFSLSITIPPKQSYAEDNPKGTFGYVDPTYMRSGYISEKGDVYSFGVLLLVFLTGQEALIRYEEGGEYESIIPYVKSHACDGQIEKIVDPKVLKEAKGDRYTQQHLHDFLALGLLCTDDSSEARPDMIDVAKELIRLEKCILSC
ncbi:hypothetical protein ACLB2K_013106 [Fragaria x ananassa]